MENENILSSYNPVEKDVFNILVDSSLFYELTFDERNKLLKEVIRKYLAS